MIIHSVSPVQMLMEQAQGIQPEIRQVSGGYVEGRQTPQGFQMSRLCSTDPQMYLQKQYAPGSMLPR